ncbi:MAG: RNA 2',3'-cyclic phosphodiesterase [Actinobacteria bacterium]|nr:RNA 2',3'-cyclic phosphodiesterase [Actinomycetota bacterium]
MVYEKKMKKPGSGAGRYSKPGQAPESIRLFIALTVPEDVRKSLYRTISILAESDRQIRQVPVENIHLTLRFLGDTRCDRIEKIMQAVGQTSQEFHKFHYLIAESPGAFPSLKSAKVLFAGVTESSEKIEEIFSKLEDGLSRIKIRKEPRKFVSHVTLARIRERKDLTESAARLLFDVKEPVLCSEIVLFESILKPAGAEYVILKRYELK